MWPDTQYSDWRSKDRLTAYGIAGFRVSNVVELQVFTARFFRKIEKLAKL